MVLILSNTKPYLKLSKYVHTCTYTHSCQAVGKYTTMATAKCQSTSGAHFTHWELAAQIQLNVKRILYIKYLITLGE